MAKKKKVKEKIDYSLVSQKKASWCINNGYKIYPVGVDKVKNVFTSFNIIIQRGAHKKRSNKVYTKIGVSNKIWEIYNFLYDKHADR